MDFDELELEDPFIDIGSFLELAVKQDGFGEVVDAPDIFPTATSQWRPGVQLTMVPQSAPVSIPRHAPQPRHTRPAGNQYQPRQNQPRPNQTQPRPNQYQPRPNQYQPRQQNQYQPRQQNQYQPRQQNQYQPRQQNQYQPRQQNQYQPRQNNNQARARQMNAGQARATFNQYQQGVQNGVRGLMSPPNQRGARAATPRRGSINNTTIVDINSILRFNHSPAARPAIRSPANRPAGNVGYLDIGQFLAAGLSQPRGSPARRPQVVRLPSGASITPITPPGATSTPLSRRPGPTRLPSVASIRRPSLDLRTNPFARPAAPGASPTRPRTYNPGVVRIPGGATYRAPAPLAARNNAARNNATANRAQAATNGAAVQSRQMAAISLQLPSSVTLFKLEKKEPLLILKPVDSPTGAATTNTTAKRKRKDALECEICQHTFTAQRYLVRHMRTHDKDVSEAASCPRRSTRVPASATVVKSEPASEEDDVDVEPPTKRSKTVAVAGPSGVVDAGRRIVPYVTRMDDVQLAVATGRRRPHHTSWLRGVTYKGAPVPKYMVDVTVDVERIVVAHERRKVKNRNAGSSGMATGTFRETTNGSGNHEVIELTDSEDEAYVDFGAFLQVDMAGQGPSAYRVNSATTMVTTARGSNSGVQPRNKGPLPKGCPVCGRTFSRIYNCRKHMEKVHNIMNGSPTYAGRSPSAPEPQFMEVDRAVSAGYHQEANQEPNQDIMGDLSKLDESMLEFFKIAQDLDSESPAVPPVGAPGEGGEGEEDEDFEPPYQDMEAFLQVSMGTSGNAAYVEPIDEDVSTDPDAILGISTNEDTINEDVSTDPDAILGISTNEGAVGGNSVNATEDVSTNEGAAEGDSANRDADDGNVTSGGDSATNQIADSGTEASGDAISDILDDCGKMDDSDKVVDSKVDVSDKVIDSDKVNESDLDELLSATESNTGPSVATNSKPSAGTDREDITDEDSVMFIESAADCSELKESEATASEPGANVASKLHVSSNAVRNSAVNHEESNEIEIVDGRVVALEPRCEASTAEADMSGIEDAELSAVEDSSLSEVVDTEAGEVNFLSVSDCLETSDNVSDDNVADPLAVDVVGAASVDPFFGDANVLTFVDPAKLVAIPVDVDGIFRDDGKNGGEAFAEAGVVDTNVCRPVSPLVIAGPTKSGPETSSDFAGADDYDAVLNGDDYSEYIDPLVKDSIELLKSDCEGMLVDDVDDVEGRFGEPPDVGLLNGFDEDVFVGAATAFEATSFDEGAAEAAFDDEMDTSGDEGMDTSTDDGVEKATGGGFVGAENGGIETSGETRDAVEESFKATSDDLEDCLVAYQLTRHYT